MIDLNVGVAELLRLTGRVWAHGSGEACAVKDKKNILFCGKLVRLAGESGVRNVDGCWNRAFIESRSGTGIHEEGLPFFRAPGHQFLQLCRGHQLLWRDLDGRV